MRLWILIGVIWGAVVSFFAFAVFPETSTDIYSKWYVELHTHARSIMPSYFGTSYSDFKSQHLEQNYEQLIIEIENDLKRHRSDFIAECQIEPNPFCGISFVDEELRNRYQNEINHNKPFKFVIRAFLIWLLPLMFVCLLGLLVGWVYQGFHQRQS